MFNTLLIMNTILPITLGERERETERHEETEREKKRERERKTERR